LSFFRLRQNVGFPAPAGKVAALGSAPTETHSPGGDA
jgi:hypothetical protein